VASFYGHNACQMDGLAYGSSVASFYFYNESSRNESLQYVVCQNDSHWDIAVLFFRYLTHASNYMIAYTSVDLAQRQYAKDCLYTAGKSVRRFVVPAGHETADLLFHPPALAAHLLDLQRIRARPSPKPGLRGHGLVNEGKLFDVNSRTQLFQRI
jgi:hypothetical protein